MKTIVRSGLVVLILGVVGSTGSLGQMRAVPLDQRVGGAGIIVEGNIVSSTPFYNPRRTLIYTAHQIEISKVFKAPGRSRKELTEIEIITQGGRVGNERQEVQPSLQLAPGDRGVFFLEKRASFAGRETAYLPYAGKQGFVRYRKTDGKAVDPFAEYPDARLDLFDPIERQIGVPAHVIRPARSAHTGSPLPTEESADASAGGPSVSSLSPGSVAAGIQEVLTIPGSGFGALTGSAAVFFDNSTDGKGGVYGAADAEHIVLWSDTEIQVMVPNRAGAFTAGSGLVIVQDELGGQASSPTELTVTYALKESITDEPAARRMSLANTNVIGGFTYQFSTSTANNGVDITAVAGATDRFLEAQEIWNCEIGWNAETFGTTAINLAENDDVNLVRFDHDADPLPGGVLGRARTYFTLCGGDTWHVTESDITFQRNGSGWYFGADPGSQGAGEDDFMSFALHELGHAVQHGHVNQPDLMSYSLTTGQNTRVLSAPNITGGVSIVNYSAGFTGCGATGMIALDCLSGPTADFTAAPLGGCGSSLSVQFTDRSLNAPTTWDWGFGDTGSDTSRNPSHLYTAQGVYSVGLTATNANGADAEVKSNHIVVTDAPATASCDAGTGSYLGGFSIGIYNVTLNSINHSTQTFTQGDPILEDFSCSQFTVLEPGASYDISVTTGPANDENVRAYIDWNDDGVLAAGEEVLQSLAVREFHNGNFAVPAGAVQDTALRLRVVSDFVSVSSACPDLSYGQAEDYSVVVKAPPPGAVPNGISGTPLSIAQNSGDPSKLDLSWGASCGAGATDYTIHEGTIGSWYSHTSLACTSGGATSATALTPGAGNRYYLVVPISSDDEGSYGLSSSIERPVSAVTCRPTQDTTTCP